MNLSGVYIIGDGNIGIQGNKASKSLLIHYILLQNQTKVAFDWHYDLG